MNSRTFVILKKNLNEYQIEKISGLYNEDDDNSWYITQNSEYITGWILDGSSHKTEDFFKLLDIDLSKVVWGK